MVHIQDAAKRAGLDVVFVKSLDDAHWRKPSHRRPHFIGLKRCRS